MLLLRRFDRERGTRLPFLSAMSMLDAKDNETRSYLEFVDVLRQHGAAPKEDMHALWRRIVFNITDLKHRRPSAQSRLSVGRSGRLAACRRPMTSIPCPPTSSRAFSTTAIDLDDGTASLQLALEVASYFELDTPEANRIAAQMGRAVATWRKEAARLGLAPKEIDRMASAFEHEDLKAALALVSRGRRGGPVRGR